MATEMVFDEDMLLSMMEAENNSRKRKSDPRDGDNRDNKRPAKDDRRNYQVFINYKNAAIGLWNKSENRVRITQMRGNFWKSTGFTQDGSNYLYPEEALLLYERASISIELATTDTNIPATAKEPEITTNELSTTNNDAITTNNDAITTTNNDSATTNEPTITNNELATTNNEPVITNNENAIKENDANKVVVSAPSNQNTKNSTPVNTNIKTVFSEFYAEILEVITLPVYLAYCKLKSLEYVTLRHNSDIPVRSFIGDIDVYEAMKTSQKSLLDTIVAYDIYLYSHQFSKKNRGNLTPTAYVIILHGYRTFSARLLFRIIAEAGDIPIIFAAAMSTGYVLLEEFTDALGSLDWENIYAREISFEQKDIVDEVLSKSQSTMKITDGSDDTKVGVADDDDSIDELAKSEDEDEDEVV